MFLNIFLTQTFVVFEMAIVSISAFLKQRVPERANVA